MPSKIDHRGMQHSDVAANDSARLRLTIQLSEAYAYITRIWIFGKNHELISKPTEEIQNPYFRVYILVAGEYTVRLEINGQVSDNAISLYKDLSFGVGLGPHDPNDKLQAPALYSSALLSGDISYKSSYNYYQDAAVRISRIHSLGTFRNGLFLFLRYPSEEIYNQTYKAESYWNRFSLLNMLGERLFQFPDNCVTDSNSFKWNKNRGCGYLGLRIDLPNGLYYLAYSGKSKRLIPIYIYERWYTQFFMTIANEPLFGSIRIFLSDTPTFNPDDKNHLLIDVCLNKIQNNDLSLNNQLLNGIAYGKYESPMLGLIGAYMYLSSHETKDDQLFKTIVRNLQEKILTESEDSPDIWALNLLSFEHFGTVISDKEKIRIEGTPMLRIAFDAIKRFATRRSWIIEEEDVNDYVSVHQTFDSPFNTFEADDNFSRDIAQKFYSNPYWMSPTDNYRKSIKDVEQIYYGRNLLKALKAKETAGRIYSISEAERNKIKAKVENASHFGHAGFAIAKLLSETESVSDMDLARRLNLPLSTIHRLVNKLLS